MKSNWFSTASERAPDWNHWMIEAVSAARAKAVAVTERFNCSTGMRSRGSRGARAAMNRSRSECGKPRSVEEISL
jgi:hypothetical protein